MTVIANQKRLSIASMESLSLGQREFGEGDVANPGASAVVENVKSLCEKILNSAEVQEKLKVYSGKFDVEIEMTQQEGIKLKVTSWGGLRSREVFSSKDLVKEADWNVLAKANQIAEKSGNGKAIPANPTTKDKVSNFWKNTKYAEKISDINSQFADYLSIARNFTKVANPSAVAVPFMLSAGGYMAIITGTWFALLAIKDFIVAACTLDVKGMFEATLSFTAFVGLICMGIGMAFISDVIFDTTAGLLFYCFIGLLSLVRLAKDSYFRYKMNQALQGVEPKQIAESLKWLQNKAKENPEEFGRRTSVDVARRITNEVNDEMLQRLTSGQDPIAMQHALYLVEEASKTNFTNIYANVLYVCISILGVLSCILKPVKTVAALFGTGAILWLMSGDQKVPKSMNLKKNLTGWMWSKNKNASWNPVWKKVDEIQKKGWTPPQLPTSSITSDRNEGSRATA